MRARKPRIALCRSRSGFTLVEMGLVVAIFVVLSAIGWGTTHAQMPRYRLIRASKQMKGDLVLLRNLAVQTNRETRMSLVWAPGDCEDTDEWGGRWQMEIGDRSQRSKAWELLPPDAAEDGVDDLQGEGSANLGDGGNREAKDVCLVQWSAIRGPGIGNADSIVFSPRGWLTNPSGDFNSEGYMELKLRNQEASRLDVDDSVNVLVTRAGMVRLDSTLGHAMIDNKVGTGATTTR